MANFIKKVIVLSLLLVAVFVVYLAKNQDVREDVLIKLGLAASKDFKTLEEITIALEDINMNRIGAKEEAAAGEVEEFQFVPGEDEIEDEPVFTEAVVGEEGFGIGSVEAWEEDKPLLSLEEIEEEVKEISQKVKVIEQEVDILVAMNEIRQEIKDLAGQAEELDLECASCNIISSI